MQVRFFAALRERAGRHTAELDLPEGSTVGDLWTAVCAELPQIGDFGRSVSFAVNREYVDATHGLRDGDEVALIPPVSGG